MTELKIKQIVSDPFTTQTLVKLQSELIEAQQEQLNEALHSLRMLKKTVLEYQQFIDKFSKQVENIIQTYDERTAS